ncbi:MAG: M20 family metallopeptidase [Pyrinomonadaceae bacterium]
MQNLKNYFENRQSGICEKISEIVEIESPSHDAEGSRKVVRWIESELAKISSDFTIEKIEAENLGEHLIIRAFESNEKNVLLLGHTDTVHPHDTKLKNPTRIDNGKLYGCGTFDMKANIVLILEVLRAFKELNLTPKYQIIILLSCDEEIGSPTGKELVEREAKRAEFCLVCEPSADGKVKTGRKGTGMFTLKAHGIPSHAGLEPEKGASAILEIARQIPNIHELNDLENGTTANVCTISGGTTSNVIPENACCEIDVRFTKQKEAERIENALKKLKSYDEKVSLEIVGEINRPPMERTEAVVKLYEKAKTIAASFDYELGETQVGGASDGNFVGALGIPVLDGLGIAGNGAHTLDEFIYIEDIPKRAALLAEMILHN